MKRFFTTLLSFILVIATMFSLSACSTSDKTLLAIILARRLQNLCHQRI